MESEDGFICSKILKPSHIYHQLNMPKNSVHSFLNVVEVGSDAYIHAMDRMGMSWMFHYCTRKRGRYLKPYLSSMGWTDFVQKKGLREGDKISFYKLPNPEGDVRFMIKAERKDQPEMLMGVRIGNTWRDINKYVVALTDDYG